MSDPACEILALGAFLPPHAADLMLRGLARLSDLDWTLAIVADAEWTAAGTQALAATLGLRARVRLLSAPEWERAALFACAVEPPALDHAAAEAFLHGLPVVALARAMGARITPDCGAVCPPGDVEQFSRAMRRLIYDGALRRDMAAAARARGQAE